MSSLAMRTSDVAARSEEARNELVTRNLSLVHHVARKFSRSLSANEELDELVSAGTIGLLSAAEAFDDSRGLAFSTFAVPRIQGAILDELRRRDHAPRAVRRHARDMARTTEALTKTLSRAPEARELADALEIDLETLWQWRADVECAVPVPLDRSALEGESTSPAPAEYLSGADEESVIDRVGKEQEVALVRDAILKLNGQERTVLALYYFEELKMHEIAEILALTESRVSQIRAKALKRLRTMLAPLGR
ncbi:MAG: FliA/WhiG family RNA polymerase sigma factor [bacterium]